MFNQLTFQKEASTFWGQMKQNHVEGGVYVILIIIIIINLYLITV